jgi:hypothetical protein
MPPAAMEYLRQVGDGAALLCTGGSSFLQAVLPKIESGLPM